MKNPFSGILIVFFFYLLKFFLSLTFDLIPDEAYYWEWSRKLDFSYYDQGPGVAYYIYFFTKLFGDNLIALRLASNFAGFLTTIFIFLTSSLLNFSKLTQTFLLFILFLIPGFFTGSMLIMHDSPLLIAWSGGIYFFSKYIKERKDFDLYLLFLFLGLGALSKHTMVFFLISIFIWLILFRDEFAIFKSYQSYLAICITALVISPIIIWNTQNNWDNIDAIINLRSAGGVNVKKFNTGSYLAGQILTLSPGFFLIGIGLFFQSLKNLIQFPSIEINASTKIRYFLGINALVLPIFFLILSIQKVIQANWVFASYLPLSIFMAEFLEKIISKHQKKYKILIYITFLICALMNVFSILSVPIVKNFNIPLNSHYVPGYRTEGFKEIIKEIENIRNTKYSDAELIANRYQDAAIGSWFADGKPFIQSFNILQKNQYNYWLDIKIGKNYLLYYIEEKPCQKSFIFFQTFLKMMFEEVIEFPEKDIIVDGKVIKRYQVWYLKNYKRSWVNPVRDILQKDLIKNSLLMGLRDSEEEYLEKLKSMKEYGDTQIDFTILDSYMNRKGELECNIFD